MSADHKWLDALRRLAKDRAATLPGDSEPARYRSRMERRRRYGPTRRSLTG
jgi:hypothetical protein